MTPLEIFEYKNKWRPGLQVILCSDLRFEGVEFCKRTFKKHEWHHLEYTASYEDTYCFEKQHHATLFRGAFRV